MDEEVTADEIEVARNHLRAGYRLGSLAATRLGVQYTESEHSVWSALAAVNGTDASSVAKLIAARGTKRGFLFTPHEMAILRALYASLLL